MPTPICPYCNNPSILLQGDKLYPKDTRFAKLNFYYCDNNHPEAYVGTHKNTLTPLGTLANAELREARKKVHRVFDQIWRSKQLSRKKAYSKLAKAMKLEPKLCHIGMFDLKLCSIAEVEAYKILHGITAIEEE